MQKSNQKEIFTENCRLVRGKKGTLMKRVAEIKRTTGLALVSFFEFSTLQEIELVVLST